MESAIAAVRDYCADIADGGRVSSGPMRLLAARTLREIDAPDRVRWDADELQAVADFVGGLRLFNYGNAPAVLHPWQLLLAGALLCRKSGDRLATRTLCLEVGKGNAKSTTAAMLSLYLLATTPYRIEIWSLATKRDQAHRIVDAAGQLARGGGIAEPDGPIQPRHRHVQQAETGSMIGSVATRERTADGLLGRLYLADECGRYVDDTLGKLAVAQAKPVAEGVLPQLVMFTTPGQNRANAYYRIRDGMEQKLRDGTIRDDEWPMLYGIDDADDAFDPAVWPKANPMLDAGVMHLADLEYLADRATATVHDRSEFTREICCRYDDRDAAFIDMALWDQCAREFDPVKLSAGRAVVAAVDLSKAHDLTAAVFATVDERGDAWIWGHAWTCEHELEARQRAGNMPYRAWAESGHLTICPGNTIDLRSVETYLRGWCDQLDVRSIYVDPVSGAADTLETWRRGGLPIVGHRQTRMDMSPPLQKLNTLVRQIEIEDQPHVFHDGHPVLRACARNTRVSVDFAGNPSAEKDKAAGRIDMFVAAVMTMTGVMELVRAPVSPYESSSLI